MKVFAILALTLGAIASAVPEAAPEADANGCGTHKLGTRCAQIDNLGCSNDHDKIITCTNHKWVVQSNCPPAGRCHCVNGKPTC